MPKPSEAFESILKTMPRKTGGTQCRVCSLPPDLLAQVTKALKGGAQLSQVSRALIKMGHPVSSAVLGNHVRGGHA